MTVVRIARTLGLAGIIVVASAHVGSPDVFFVGKAGPYDIRVVVRPPEVVPGVAQVTVRVPADVERVTIRPVFWRAGSRGAPTPDEARRVAGEKTAFEGSLWLMARGAYTVDVTVEGARGSGSASVPVASVATGRLALNPLLGGLLAALGLVLVAGLVNIVHKGAGESLVEPGAAMEPARRVRARLAAVVALPVIAVAILGGARWWNVVDVAYERTIFRRPPLPLRLENGVLIVKVNDLLTRSSGREFPLLRDHGKLMHLFLVRQDDARAFAHVHPVISSDSAFLFAALPGVPAGTYHAFGDIVDETGFERTVVGTVAIPASGGVSPSRARVHADPDDASFVGDASLERTTQLADGSTMTLDIVSDASLVSGREVMLRVAVRGRDGKLARLEPYLGMPAHAVVTRLDGEVFVHLHPMGTFTSAAQLAFAARDRGDTTADGRLRLERHTLHASAMAAAPEWIDFPYAFPKSGSYRLFVQVKRNARVLTGAYAITVAAGANAR